jgi:hypothetical protein
MAIEEIDPETGEVKTTANPQDEIAALQAKLAALTGATQAAPAADPAPVHKVADEVPLTEEEIDQKAKAEAAAQAAAQAATQKLSDQAKAAKPPAKQPAKGTAVAQAATGGALTTGAPSDLDALFLQHAGRGLNFETRDLQIPRIALLQDNSPQVKKGTMTYIQGAEAGMLMDTVKEGPDALMTEAFIVPVFYKRRFVAWKPRDEKGGGGGLVRPDVPESEYKTLEEVSIGKRAYMDQKIGLVEVVDTPEWAVLLSTDGLVYRPAVISMAGTKAKVAARMNTVIMSQILIGPDGAEHIPPIYANLFTLGSKREGEGSEAYFNFTSTYQGRVPTAAIFHKAARYAQQFSAGELDAAPMVQD